MRTSTQWPTRNLALDLFNEMDKFWQDDYTLAVRPSIYTDRGYNPVCELIEGEDHFLMSVDLPGMKKEDIKIEMANDLLTVSGERKRQTTNKDHKFQYYEKTYGYFKRSFALPATVQAEKIEARYENGILELYVPKAASAKTRQIQIQSEKGGFLDRILGPKKEPSELKNVNELDNS